MAEKHEYPFQASSIEFLFEQDSNNWWNTYATRYAKRSNDGEEWEVAKIKIQILDRDTANAIMTCWKVFSDVDKDCEGDLFNYKDSEFYTETIGEE